MTLRDGFYGSLAIYVRLGSPRTLASPFVGASAIRGNDDADRRSLPFDRERVPHQFGDLQRGLVALPLQRRHDSVPPLGGMVVGGQTNDEGLWLNGPLGPMDQTMTLPW